MPLLHHNHHSLMKWVIIFILTMWDSYTAYHFYGITQPAYPFCFAAGRNIWQFQLKKWQHIKERPGLLKKKIMVYHHLDPVPVDQLFFLGVPISPIAPKTVCRICVDHTQLWAIAVCKLPSQTKVAITPTNIWPVIIEIIVRLVGRKLSQKKISVITRESCVHLTRYVKLRIAHAPEMPGMFSLPPTLRKTYD